MSRRSRVPRATGRIDLIRAEAGRCHSGARLAQSHWAAHCGARFSADSLAFRAALCRGACLAAA